VLFISPKVDGVVTAAPEAATTVGVWIKLMNPDGQLKVDPPVQIGIVGRTTRLNPFR